MTHLTTARLLQEYTAAQEERLELEADPLASQTYTALLRAYCQRLDTELLARGLFYERAALQESLMPQLPRPILVIYDPHTRRVLSDPGRGQDRDEVLDALGERLFLAGWNYREVPVQLNPWWRWWQATPAVRLEVLGRLA